MDSDYDRIYCERLSDQVHITDIMYIHVCQSSNEALQFLTYYKSMELKMR